MKEFIREKKGHVIFLVALALVTLLAISLTMAGKPSDNTGAPTSTECSDKRDNDGDGYCDVAGKKARCSDGSIPGDPDCSASTDNQEAPDCVPVTEICDGADNDCDSLVDEGVTATYYLDEDGDLYGKTGSGQELCVPSGFVNTQIDGDCDDQNAQVYPGYAEVCDGIDNNCNSNIDEGLAVECSSTSQCGESGWIGETYCTNGQVYRDYIVYQCNFPNACNSYCSSDLQSYPYAWCANGCLAGTCIGSVNGTNSSG